MDPGKESRPIQLPVPVVPDEAPSETPATPAPQPEQVPA